jgi:hypothetical protein
VEQAPDREGEGGQAAVLFSPLRREPDRKLRSLDAIHLATARILAPELDALVTYHERLIVAATDAGLPTASPGTDAP